MPLLSAIAADSGALVKNKFFMNGLPFACWHRMMTRHFAGCLMIRLDPPQARPFGYGLVCSAPVTHRKSMR